MSSLPQSIEAPTETTPAPVIVKRPRSMTEECYECHRRVSYIGDRPKLCPYCDAPGWHIFAADERLCFRHQKTYIDSSRDNEKLNALFSALKFYARNIILGKIRRGAKRISAESLNDKSHEMATSFILQYLKKPDYEVGTSFGGLLNQIYKGVMFSVSSYDLRKAFSLNSSMFEDTEFIDRFMNFAEVPYDLFDKTLMNEHQFNEVYEQKSGDELEQAFDKVVHTIFSRQSWTNAMLFTLGFLGKLRNNRKNTCVSHLQLMYDGQVQDNVDRADLLLRTTISEGL